MREKTTAIVQVSGTRFDKDEEVIFEEMENMVPCHSSWEELLDPLSKEDVGSELRPSYDSVVREPVIGLEFYSVGDWPEGSFFDNEKEMVGIEEVVGNFKDELVEEIKAKFSSWLPSGLSNLHDEVPRTMTILTLWTGQSWQDWEGEWDFEFGYDGVIDLSKLSQILESKQ